MIDTEVPTLPADEQHVSTAHALALAFVAAAARRFPVKRAVLFGSRARGNSGPDSDTDVALILAGEPASFTETKLALADLAFDVMLETGVLIQAWPIWEAPQTHANPSLVWNIRREGIAL